jgi:pimeloyl-ACP methyl ester carboxylesterase
LVRSELAGEESKNVEAERSMKLPTRIVVLGLVVILASALLIGVLTVEACPEPGRRAHPNLQNPPDPQPDPLWIKSIYYGAVPPENPDGPVLVFVHGYRGTADNWWTTTPYHELNDMYIMAYQAGYRTAFVSLGGPDGSETGSMWDNGEVLRWQLGIIASHYGVDALDVVAHSKGGVDAQAYVVHFGGWRLVRHVFTLGSPHHGTELADLLYSDWAGWLARLLGLQDEATYTLQTGYMEVFRALTDPMVATQDVIYYRAAGTDTGPQFSGLWLSGLYLSLFGPNDGAVTVASTELPGAHTLFIEPYHHLNIFLGHTALPWIDGALNGEEPNRHQVYLPLVTADVIPESPSHSEVILRGGWVSDTVTETIPIESGALKVTFDLMVPSDTVTATLTAPDALPCSLEVVPPTGDWLFGQVWHLVYVEDNPVAGEWMFTINSPEESAYLLVAMVESPLEVALRGWPEGMMRPGDSLFLNAEASHPVGQPVVRCIEGQVTRALPTGSKGAGVQGSSQTGTILSCTSARLHLCTSALPEKEGIYVVSATVTGEMPDGMPFERSFVHSLAVAKPETLRGEATLLDR